MGLVDDKFKLFRVFSGFTPLNEEGAEEKLGIFCYNKKRLFYKTRLILIKKQNKR